MDSDHKDFFSGMLKETLLKYLYFNKIAANVVPHYLWSIKVLNRNPFEKPFITVTDLDDTQPDVFHDAYELSSSVMVRTYASQNLAKSNVT